MAAGPATGRPSARACSSCSIRRTRSSRVDASTGGEPGVLPVDVANRTRATSRSTRGSGARRMSTRAVPSTSSALVIVAGERDSANDSARDRSSSESWSGGTPMRTRKASRSADSSASPRTRGSRPRETPVAIDPSAAAASESAMAASSSAVVVSSGTAPPATARSRAESASRAEPRPARTACA